MSLRRDVFDRLQELQRRKYPGATTNTALISAMIADLSKDLEPRHETISYSMPNQIAWQNLAKLSG